MDFSEIMMNGTVTEQVPVWNKYLDGEKTHNHMPTAFYTWDLQEGQ